MYNSPKATYTMDQSPLNTRSGASHTTVACAWTSSDSGSTRVLFWAFPTGCDRARGKKQGATRNGIWTTSTMQPGAQGSRNIQSCRTHSQGMHTPLGSRSGGGRGRQFHTRTERRTSRWQAGRHRGRHTRRRHGPEGWCLAGGGTKTAATPAASALEQKKNNVRWGMGGGGTVV